MDWVAFLYGDMVRPKRARKSSKGGVRKRAKLQIQNAKTQSQNPPNAEIIDCTSQELKAKGSGLSWGCAADNGKNPEVSKGIPIPVDDGKNRENSGKKKFVGKRLGLEKFKERGNRGRGGKTRGGGSRKYWGPGRNFNYEKHLVKSGYDVFGGENRYIGERLAVESEVNGFDGENNRMKDRIVFKSEINEYDCENRNEEEKVVVKSEVNAFNWETTKVKEEVLVKSEVCDFYGENTNADKGEVAGEGSGGVAGGMAFYSEQSQEYGRCNNEGRGLRGRIRGRDRGFVRGRDFNTGRKISDVGGFENFVSKGTYGGAGGIESEQGGFNHEESTGRFRGRGGFGRGTERSEQVGFDHGESRGRFRGRGGFGRGTERSEQGGFDHGESRGRFRGRGGFGRGTEKSEQGWFDHGESRGGFRGRGGFGRGSKRSVQGGFDHGESRGTFRGRGGFDRGKGRSSDGGVVSGGSSGSRSTLFSNEWSDQQIQDVLYSITDIRRFWCMKQDSIIWNELRRKVKPTFKTGIDYVKMLLVRQMEHPEVDGLAKYFVSLPAFIREKTNLFQLYDYEIRARYRNMSIVQKNEYVFNYQQEKKDFLLKWFNFYKKNPKVYQELCDRDYMKKVRNIILFSWME